MADSTAHHHRSTLTQRNKPFKGGSNSGRRAGRRVGGKLAGGSPGAPPTPTAGRMASKKSAASQKRKALVEAARARRAASESAPPLLLAVVPLGDAAAPATAVCEAFTAHLDGPGRGRTDADGNGGRRGTEWAVPRKMAGGGAEVPRRVSFLPVDRTRAEFVQAVADACKVADALVFVVPAVAEPAFDDLFADPALAVVRAMGGGILAGATVAWLAPDDGPAGAQMPPAPVRVAWGLALERQSLGTAAEMRPHNAAELSALRAVMARGWRAASKPRKTWRSGRPYMLVEGMERGGEDGGVVLEGVLRGEAMNADRLVHVTGVGTYAVERLVVAGTGEVVSERGEGGEPVDSEAEGDDELMREQTFPPEDEDDGAGTGAGSSAGRRLKRRPKGWSEYQAAWIADEGSEDDGGEGEGEDDSGGDEGDDDGDDYEEDDDDMDLETRPGGVAQDDEADADPTLRPASNNHPLNMDTDTTTTDHGSMPDAPATADEVHRARTAAREDAQFPDEVDVPMDRAARLRFAKYRGLKSLRTSPWDPKEMLPEEYARIFQFADFTATRRRVLRQEAAERGGAVARVGTRIRIHVPSVSEEERALMEGTLGCGMPLIASGLHGHENRRTVAHARIRVSEVSASPDPIKSKTALTLQCGFVRVRARALFSEDNANSTKHKFERFLHPQRFSVATFYGPAVYAPAPVIVLPAPPTPPTPPPTPPPVLATGTLLPPDADRVVLKRVVITGYPFKIHKSRAVVRFMFVNREDVRWFQPVELWTKYGRTGKILEPVGTHGYMKCVFDAPVAHHDTVCMSLYKRVYPKRWERDEGAAE